MPTPHEKTAIKATYFSIVGNASLAVIKAVAGFWGNSYALIADAILYNELDMIRLFAVHKPLVIQYFRLQDP
jgi:divalent metal cation (Fe/Co/Zn/Cd) transporter